MKLVSNSDVEWIVGEGYRKKILLRDDDVNLKGGLVQLVEIPPHTKVREHYHKSCTEVFHVLSGQGTFVIDETTINLAPGQTLTCEPYEVHSTENPFDEPFNYIVFKTNVVENDLFWCSV
ncbi:MAG: cupin domain-containing protein [Roseibium sp.]|uniref:cupin domain-containing protein n=1 Tax=Roseibium sp. TaxID=1936156 RepID=UPI0026300658|nr:cupin domain-containing protein [Roseibium sp.]MCV0429637.1 cupin domain-containing protein [Roseibium sp.]